MEGVELQQVVIRGTETVKEPKPYTVYRIEVFTRTSHWCVLRRYNEFHELHDAGGVAKDALPQKKLFGSMTPETIEARRRQLEAYVQALVADKSPQVSRAPELMKFLDVHSHDVVGATQSLTEELYYNGEAILESGRPFSTTPLQLAGLCKRLKLAGAQIADDNMSVEKRRLFEFVTKLSHLKIRSPDDDAQQSKMVYDLSVFKALAMLEIDGCDVGAIEGLRSLQQRLVHISVRHSIKALKEFLVDCVSVIGVNSNTLDIVVHAWSAAVFADFSHNNLAAIDDSIKLLPALETLMASHNNLTAMPALGSLRRLTRLDLSHNKIRSIEGLADALPLLTSLVVRANKIEALGGVERLEYLTVLDVGDNAVADIRETNSLGQLSRLESLTLAGNPISTHPKYRAHVIGVFLAAEKRIILDGQSATQKDMEKIGEITAKLALDHAIALTNDSEIEVAQPPLSPSKRKARKSRVAVIEVARPRVSVDAASEANPAPLPLPLDCDDTFRATIARLKEERGADWLRALNESSPMAAQPPPQSSVVAARKPEKKKKKPRPDALGSSRDRESLRLSADSLDSPYSPGALSPALSPGPFGQNAAPLPGPPPVEGRSATTSDAATRVSQKDLAPVIAPPPEPAPVEETAEEKRARVQREFQLQYEAAVREGRAAGAKSAVHLARAYHGKGSDEGFECVLNVDVNRGTVTEVDADTGRIRGKLAAKALLSVAAALGERGPTVTLTFSDAADHIELVMESARVCGELAAMLLPFVPGGGTGDGSAAVARAEQAAAPPQAQPQPRARPAEVAPGEGPWGAQADGLLRLSTPLVTHLRQTVFAAPDEVCECVLRVPYLLYGDPSPKEHVACVVVSTAGIYLVAPAKPGRRADRRIATFRLDELRFVTVGMFDQSVRLEFGRQATYSLLTRDHSVTNGFTDALTRALKARVAAERDGGADGGSVRRSMFFAEADEETVSRFEYVFRNGTTRFLYPSTDTVDVLRFQLTRGFAADDPRRSDFQVFSYLVCFQRRATTGSSAPSTKRPKPIPRTLILTGDTIYLCDEDHVNWPLPQFETIEPQTSQYSVVSAQRVAAVVGVETSESAPGDFVLLLESGTGLTATENWHIVTKRREQRDQFVRVLLRLWSDLFKLPLQVTSVAGWG